MINVIKFYQNIIILYRYIRYKRASIESPEFSRILQNPQNPHRIPRIFTKSSQNLHRISTESPQNIPRISTEYS